MLKECDPIGQKQYPAKRLFYTHAAHHRYAIESLSFARCTLFVDLDQVEAGRSRSRIGGNSRSAGGDWGRVGGRALRSELNIDVVGLEEGVADDTADLNLSIEGPLVAWTIGESCVAVGTTDSFDGLAVNTSHLAAGLSSIIGEDLDGAEFLVFEAGTEDLLLSAVCSEWNVEEEGISAESDFDAGIDSGALGGSSE